MNAIPDELDEASTIMSTGTREPASTYTKSPTRMRYDKVRFFCLR